MSRPRLHCPYGRHRRGILLAALFALVAISAVLLLDAQPVQASIFGSSAPPDPTKADEKDLYGLLGVKKSATEHQVKKAFRKLARVHHPDLQSVDDAKEEAKLYMVKLLRAYDVLTDEKKRQDFDNFGVIPGLADAAAPTEDIFQYYHQTAVIPSTTPTLESVEHLQRMLNFRGHRVFLIQAYSDDENKARLFSPSWEKFRESKLASGHIVKMFRIDVKSSTAPELLALLGLTTSCTIPTVVAIVDGEIWKYSNLLSNMQEKERLQFRGLLEFVMDFFETIYGDVKSLYFSGTGALITWLQEPWSARAQERIAITEPHKAARPNDLRVILASKGAETVSLTLDVLYPDIPVRTTRVSSLLDFIEQYCEVDLNTMSRYGREGLESSDVIAVISEPLPTEYPSCAGVVFGVTTSATLRKVEGLISEALIEKAEKRLADRLFAAKGSAAEGEEGDADDEHEAPSKPIRGVMLTSAPPSSTLSNEADGTTVSSPLPTSPLLELTGDNYLDICGVHCVLWLHDGVCDDAIYPQVGSKTLDAHGKRVAELMHADLRPYNAAVVCLRKESTLSSALAAMAVSALKASRGAASNRPVVIAITNGDDSTAHVVVRENDPLTQTRQIIEKLADLVSGEAAEAGNNEEYENAEAGDNGPSHQHHENIKHIPMPPFRTVGLSTPLSKLLITTEFKISTWQRVWMISAKYLAYINPFVSNTMPFVAMYYVHNRWGGRQGNTEENAAGDANASGGATAPGAPGAKAPAKAPAKGKAKKGPRPNRITASGSGVGQVKQLAEEDITAARTAGSKGYLVLVFDDRPAGTASAPVELPSVSNNADIFSIRKVSAQQHEETAQWMRSLYPAAAEQEADGEKRVFAVAVRRGRGKLSVRPLDQTLDAWMNDLLDGAKNVTSEVPAWLSVVAAGEESGTKSAASPEVKTAAEQEEENVAQNPKDIPAESTATEAEETQKEETTAEAATEKTPESAEGKSAAEE